MWAQACSLKKEEPPGSSAEVSHVAFLWEILTSSDEPPQEVKERVKLLPVSSEALPESHLRFPGLIHDDPTPY